MEREGVIGATEDLQALKDAGDAAVVMVTCRNPCGFSHCKTTTLIDSDLLGGIVIAFETIEIEHSVKSTYEPCPQCGITPKRLNYLGV